MSGRGSKQYIKQYISVSSRGPRTIAQAVHNACTQGHNVLQCAAHLSTHLHHTTTHSLCHNSFPDIRT